MSDFTTTAELDIRVPDSELRGARRTIEDELGDVETGIGIAIGEVDDTTRGQLAGILDASQRQVGLLEETVEAQLGGDERDSRERRRRRREFRWARQRTQFAEEQAALLAEIKEAVEEGDGGAAGLVGTAAGILGRGGGGAVGGGIGGGIGTTALGVGGAAGLAGLGIGAGIGAATGQFAQEEFVIDVGNVQPILEGPFVENPQFNVQPDIDAGDISVEIGEEALQLDPQVNIGAGAFAFEPQFTPEMFDIAVNAQLDIGTGAFDFAPQFGPEQFDFNPVIEQGALQLGPENIEAPEVNVGDITIDPSLNFSPSIDFSPSISITGVDIGNVSAELADVVVNSRTFRNELESELSSLEGDLEDRILDALGG